MLRWGLVKSETINVSKKKWHINGGDDAVSENVSDRGSIGVYSREKSLLSENMHRCLVKRPRARGRPPTKLRARTIGQSGLVTTQWARSCTVTDTYVRNARRGHKYRQTDRLNEALSSLRSSFDVGRLCVYLLLGERRRFKSSNLLLPLPTECRSE